MDQPEIDTDELTRKISNIWSSILRRDITDVNHHFLDLGGDSLQATVIALTVSEAFFIKIAVGDVYSNPTVRAFSDKVAIILRDARE